MRTEFLAAAAVLLLTAADVTAQATRPASSTDDEVGSSEAVAFDPALVGTWKSAPDALKLTSEFDQSVWGTDASSVRTVVLAVQPSGEGTLTVTKKVVDARGRTVDASTWVEEVRLKLGAPRDGIATRIEHQTSVVSAVRLFPDDPDYRWTLDGLRVQVVTFRDGDRNTMEVRYDTPEGRGSFWETLERDGAAKPRRTAAR